jgi:hypothetical protein
VLQSLFVARCSPAGWSLCGHLEAASNGFGLRFDVVPVDTYYLSLSDRRYPASKRSGWCGRSYAADWKNSLTSTQRSSSKNCASSFQADSLANSIKRLFGESAFGARQLSRAASSLGRRHIVEAVRSRVVDLPRSLDGVTGRPGT